MTALILMMIATNNGIRVPTLAWIAWALWAVVWMLSALFKGVDK